MILSIQNYFCYNHPVLQLSPVSPTKRVWRDRDGEGENKKGQKEKKREKERSDYREQKRDYDQIDCLCGTTLSTPAQPHIHLLESRLPNWEGTKEEIQAI